MSLVAFFVFNVSAFGDLTNCLYDKNGEKICKGEVQVIAGLNAIVQDVSFFVVTIEMHVLQFACIGNFITE